MSDQITAGQVVKYINENTLNNRKGMKSTCVSNVLCKLDVPALNALQGGIDKTFAIKKSDELLALVSKMKGMKASEEEILEAYRQV